MGDLSAPQAACSSFHRLRTAQTKVGINPHQPNYPRDWWRLLGCGSFGFEYLQAVKNLEPQFSAGLLNAPAMRLLCKQSLPACFPVAVFSQRVSYAQSDAYHQQKVLWLKLQWTQTVPLTHMPLFQCGERMKRYNCAYCVTLQCPLHMATIWLPVRQPWSLQSQWEETETSRNQFRLGTWFCWGRLNAGPNVYISNSAISTVENSTMCLSH